MTPNEPSSPVENPLAEGLLNERSPDPFTIVIFGATGDLTARKLIPALFALCADGRLPQRFAIVGAARREKSDSEFREEMAAALEKHSTRARADGAKTPADWDNFARRLFYHRMSFDDAGAYTTLEKRLAEVDAELGLPGNRLFYLSTRPSQFAVVLDQLRKAGMARPPGKSSVWQRVIIEKPFGRDRDSARELNRQVGETLDERQVFRIDHYLGKETVQNLMTFRFANAIFEPLWNRRHVASIQITAAETVGMEGGRGGYYDSAGALRDMVQNHLFQLLSLVAMEPPSRFDADAIRDGKVNVLRTLEPMTPDEVALNTVRGQYGKGSLMGAEVDAYRDQPGVDPQSQTETYVALRLKLDNWRWAGVPFLLRTGKRMPKRATEIAIQFRLPPVGLFKRRRALPAAKGGEWLAPNILLLHLQPDEGISLMFDAKTPGMTMEVQPVKMDFRYGTSFGSPSPEAYERLLLDALIGDSTLFTRNDEVEAAWEFITSVHEGWDAAPPPDFPNYAAGEWGPPEADRLTHPGEGAWRRL